MKCKNCKNEIEADSKFCKFCGNKIMAFHFIVENKDIFLSLLSIYYPFTSEEIEAYQKEIEWGNRSDFYEFQGIGTNSKIEWTDNLIEKYKNQIDFNELILNKSINWNIIRIKRYSHKIYWEEPHIFQNDQITWTDEILKYVGSNVQKTFLSYSTNINWNFNLINQNQDLIDWDVFCRNESVPWNLELINKFKDKIDWKFLSSNKSLVWDLEMYQAYKNKANFYTKQYSYLSYDFGIDTKINHELYEEFKNHFAKLRIWHGLSANTNLKWTEDFIRQNDEKWDWCLLSFNPSIPWSKSLISEYQHKIYFNQLSGNKGVLWDEDIIREHKDKLLIGTIEEIENGMTSRTYGIDNSDNLKVSNVFLDYYSEEWNWKFLGRNKNIEWTEELFSKHKSKLDLGYDYLQPHFSNIWDKLFKPIVDKNNLPLILEAIKEQKQIDKDEEQKYEDLMDQEFIKRQENKENLGSNDVLPF